MTDWKPDICVYHGGCDDGFGAAFAVWQRWGRNVHYIPAGYSAPIAWPVGLDSKHILFVDFSLKRPEMEALAWSTRSVVVLDHHKTAEAELKPYTVIGCDGGPAPLVGKLADVPGMLRDMSEYGRPQVLAFFDMEKSGARMAWEFCVGPDVPALIAHIEDRDLWRFALPGTREFSAALRTYPHDFDTWSTLTPAALIAEGCSILRGHEKNIDAFCRHAYEMEIGGHTVPVVNVPYHYASDTANELLKRFPEAPFAACWFQIAAGKRQFSLRSEDARVDVSEIARRLGGGGHRNAAGFEEVMR